MKYVTLHSEKAPYDIGTCQFDRDTHQFKNQTEKTSFANGGPYKTLNGTKL